MDHIFLRLDHIQREHYGFPDIPTVEIQSQQKSRRWKVTFRIKFHSWKSDRSTFKRFPRLVKRMVVECSSYFSFSGRILVTSFINSTAVSRLYRNWLNCCKNRMRWSPLVMINPLTNSIFLLNIRCCVLLLFSLPFLKDSQCFRRSLRCIIIVQYSLEKKERKSKSNERFSSVFSISLYLHFNCPFLRRNKQTGHSFL